MSTAAHQGRGAAVKPVMRKPVFVKVDQLKPGTSGHTLVVKVVNSITVSQKGRAASAQSRQTRISECLVGDETGAIIFTARNEQGLLVGIDQGLMHEVEAKAVSHKWWLGWLHLVDIMTPGATVVIRNAKIDMFKGSMRLVVDKWGRVEVAEPASFAVKEENNLSLVEYELVNVAEE